jgi:hypothetical protein
VIPRFVFPDLESTIRISEPMVPHAIWRAFGAIEILVSGEGELSVGLYRSAFSNLNHQRIVSVSVQRRFGLKVCNILISLYLRIDYRD